MKANLLKLTALKAAHKHIFASKLFDLAHLPPVGIIHVHHMKHITCPEGNTHLFTGYQWVL